MATIEEREAPMNVGRVVRVIGPVIDVEFAPESMPAIYNALRIDAESPVGPVRLIALDRRGPAAPRG